MADLQRPIGRPPWIIEQSICNHTLQCVGSGKYRLLGQAECKPWDEADLDQRTGFGYCSCFHWFASSGPQCDSITARSLLYLCLAWLNLAYCVFLLLRSIIAIKYSMILDKKQLRSFDAKITSLLCCVCCLLFVLMMEISTTFQIFNYKYFEARTLRSVGLSMSGVLSLISCSNLSAVIYEAYSLNIKSKSQQIHSYVNHLVFGSVTFGLTAIFLSIKRQFNIVFVISMVVSVFTCGVSAKVTGLMENKLKEMNEVASHIRLLQLIKNMNRLTKYIIIGTILIVGGLVISIVAPLKREGNGFYEKENGVQLAVYGTLLYCRGVLLFVEDSLSAKYSVDKRSFHISRLCSRKQPIAPAPSDEKGSDLFASTIVEDNTVTNSTMVENVAPSKHGSNSNSTVHQHKVVQN